MPGGLNPDMQWQRWARLLIAVAAVGFAVMLAFAFRDRPEEDDSAILVPTDPEAVVESAGGLTLRFDRDEEQVRLEYERLLTYEDGRTRMLGVKVTTDRGEGKTYVLEGREGTASDDDSAIEVVGDVRMTSSDGLVLEAEQATYRRQDGLVRAPGLVTFVKGRTSGHSTAMTYDLNLDIVTLLDDVFVRVAPDERESGFEVASGFAEFRRLESVIRFEGSLKGRRGAEGIEADAGTARLGGESEYLERLELRGRSRITPVAPTPGTLESMSGRDIDLDYLNAGQTLDRAVIVDNAQIRLAGERGGEGRRIAAGRLDLRMAPDGATLMTLEARTLVRMDLASGPEGAQRWVQASAFDGDGDETQGLTGGRFTGDVVFREQGGSRDRTARSRVLEVVLEPGLGDIEEAQFEGGVTFEDGAMSAVAGRATYRLAEDTLALRASPTEPTPPRLEDERLTVEAVRIDLEFEGPQIRAEGSVKSELLPDPGPAQGSGETVSTRRPSMLDGDRPVLVVADRLAYDGAAATATYTGNAQLAQGDTSIKAGSIVLNEKTGDLQADGSVITTTVLEQTTSTGEREQVPSIARAATFRYQEADRRATYETGAQVGGPQGDLRAAKIELFLLPSGNELERVEAYDEVVLIERGRRTTGSRLTYVSEESKYLVLGEPVRIVDECGRETIGRTLTFFQDTDRVIVDGSEQIRTRTTGASQCP